MTERADDLARLCTEVVRKGEDFPTVWQTHLKGHPLVDGIPRSRMDGNAVHVMRIATGQIMEDISTLESEGRTRPRLPLVGGAESLSGQDVGKTTGGDCQKSRRGSLEAPRLEIKKQLNAFVSKTSRFRSLCLVIFGARVIRS